MNLARSLRLAALGVLVATTALSVSACENTPTAKHAKIVPGPMPEGESWTGVYFHQVFGYLHLQEEGANVVGRWKRADQSRWGELSGTQKGNVFHYTWKEHTIGMIGASATTKGKGYFVYKMDKENRPMLEGQYGLNDDETGSDWSCIKQARMSPDLKSIGGDSEGVPPSSF